MKMKKRLTIISFVVALVIGAAITATAQVATGGTYSLDQSVIAGGGGQNAAGGTYSLDGTIGQAIAGTTSSNSPFSVAGGFFTAAPVAPTAASVSVSGRVVTDDGRGLRNARVVLTDAIGNSRTALTTSFGYYRFDDVAAGQTYIISVASKRFQFAPQVITVSEEIENLNFSALP